MNRERAPDDSRKGGRALTALRSMLRWDMRLQYRYGFYTVYGILTVVFVLGLRALAADLRTDAAVLLIVLDPTVLGFYFIAAMVLFEKQEGVLYVLVVSPLGDDGYLISKQCTLSLLAVVAAVLVAVLGHGGVSNFSVLVTGVALSASLFMLIGFVAVARFNSINEYFISAVGWGTILFLPLFGYLGFVETRLFYLLPAQPVLLLIEGGFRPVALWEVVYGIGYLVMGNIVAYVWARRSFRRYIVQGGDPGRKLGHGPVSARTERTRGRWISPQSPLTGMAIADLRNWFRDPMLVIAAIGPLVLASSIRVGTPTVAEMATPVVALEQYYPVIAGSMAVFAPALYGFIVGMFVLEDREQGVLTTFRTSPLSDRGYVLYRAGIAYVLSLIATLPALAVIGLTPAPIAILVGTAVVGAFGGPILTLAFGTMASNTIEGLALSKLVNVFVLGPAVIIAVVPEPFQFVGGIVPTFWPVKTYVAGIDGGYIWLVYMAIGVTLHLGMMVLLAIHFSGRSD